MVLTRSETDSSGTRTPERHEFTVVRGVKEEKEKNREKEIDR